jgi:ABC-type Na+ efflux pump permease subunit
VSPAPSSAPADDEKIGPGRIVAAIIFALLAIAFLVAACIYLTTPAHSLPSFMGYARTRAIHRLYAVGTFLIGLAFAVATWFALRYRSLALEEAREAEQAAEAAPQAAISPKPEEDADPLDDTQPMDATHP